LSFSASASGQESAEGPRADYFPKVTLINQDNKEVSFYEDLIKGKLVLINVMYTQCDGNLCANGTQNLVKLQKLLGDRLGREVFIYSISLQPEHDTPGVLKQYANEYGVKPGWQLLTGKPEDIQQLLDKLGMSTPDLKVVGDPKRHSGMIKIGNEATDKWSSTSVLADPYRILELIARVKPPKRP
jgi:protein SCO1/2